VLPSTYDFFSYRYVSLSGSRMESLDFEKLATQGPACEQNPM